MGKVVGVNGNIVGSCEVLGLILFCVCVCCADLESALGMSLSGTAVSENGSSKRKVSTVGQQHWGGVRLTGHSDADHSHTSHTSQSTLLKE